MSENTKGQNQQLMELIYKDELTRLFNRRYYNKFFEQIAHKSREQKLFLSFLMIDVDHFKGFNDTYGHEKGDEVLMEVASAMAEAVGKNGIPIRYAGDEFVVLLPDFKKEDAIKKAHTIGEAVGKKEILIESTGEKLHVTLSIGVATYPDHTNNPHQLQEIADQGTYICKKRGRNGVNSIDDEEAENLEPATIHRYFPCRKMMGRDQIMGNMNRYISPGVQKRPMVLFQGPPGIGKTRILEELYYASDKQRCFSLKSRSSPITAGQPFVEILEYLSNLLGDNKEVASQVAARLDSHQLHVILPFLPVLSAYTVAEKTRMALPPHQRKEAILEGMREILIAISEQKPLLIFIDDFHFSNLGTRLLLSQLKRDERADNIAVFATVCEYELVKLKDFELLDFLNTSEQDKILERIFLKSLDISQHNLMVNSIVKGLGDRHELMELFMDFTRGVPGKIEELLKSLIFRKFISIKDGVLILEEITEEEIRLDEGTLGTHAFKIDEDIRSLLSKASVMGKNFNPELLKDVENKTESRIYEMLERAEKSDLVRRVPRGGGREEYEFRSDAVLNKFYQELSEAEKHETHQKIADAESKVNQQDIDAIASKLAYHFEKGGNADKSLEFLNKISMNFSGLFSPAQIELYVGRLPSIEDWGVEDTLDYQRERKALRVCKRFHLAVQNMSKYPAESEIVKGSLESAYQEIHHVLSDTNILSFSDAEGEIILNNEQPLIEENEDYHHREFLDMLAQVGLKGISFRRGFSRVEFMKLVEILTTLNTDQIEHLGGWQVLLRKSGLKNIQVNQRIYVAMSQTELIDKRSIKKERITIRDHIQNKTPSAGSGGGTVVVPQESLPEELKAEMEKILSQYSHDAELVNFIQNIYKIAGSQPQRGTGDGKKTPSPAETEDTQSPEKDKKETTPSGKISINTGVSASDAIKISQFIKRQDLLLMEKLKMDTDILISQLDSSDFEIAQAAAGALISQGEQVIQPLYDFVMRTENNQAKRIAVKILKSRHPNLGKRLLEDLLGNSNAKIRRRILDILQEFPGAPLIDAARIILRDPDHKIRRLFLNLFESRPSDILAEVLLECLNSEDEGVVIDAIYSLGKMRSPVAVPYLVKLVRRRWIVENDDKFPIQEAACKALGQIGGDRALKTLADIMGINPFFFIIRNKPETIRAAAVYALGYFPWEQVSLILSRAEKDFSPVVRSAARLAKKMHTSFWEEDELTPEDIAIARGKVPSEEKEDI